MAREISSRVKKEGLTPQVECALTPQVECALTQTLCYPHVYIFFPFNSFIF